MQTFSTPLQPPLGVLARPVLLSKDQVRAMEGARTRMAYRRMSLLDHAALQYFSSSSRRQRRGGGDACRFQRPRQRGGKPLRVLPKRQTIRGDDSCESGGVTSILGLFFEGATSGPRSAVRALWLGRTGAYRAFIQLILYSITWSLMSRVEIINYSIPPAIVYSDGAYVRHSVRKPAPSAEMEIGLNY